MTAIYYEQQLRNGLENSYKSISGYINELQHEALESDTLINDSQLVADYNSYIMYLHFLQQSLIFAHEYIERMHESLVARYDPQES